MLFLTKGAKALLEGALAVILSLLMWRLTGNGWAWFVLFAPGSALTVYGLYRVIVLDDN